jgi:hypothetical protein
MDIHDEHLRRLVANIRRNSAVLLDNLKAMGDQLRQVKEVMPSSELFNQWALQEFGLDEGTVKDIFAFDGTMATVTDRIVQWIFESERRRRAS